MSSRALTLAVISLVFQLDVALASNPDSIDFPIKGHIRGTTPVLAKKKPICIVVGETHGTMEIPLLVSVLVRSASSDTKTVVCLEIPKAEEQQLKTFLLSDGGKEAVRGILSGSHWSSKDGRAGKGHFSLLELCRRLVQEGRDVHVAAIDIDPSEAPDPSKDDFTPSKAFEFARKRDRVMAENVVAVTKESPGANVIVLVGNVHASLKKGMPWDDEYEPMSMQLQQKLTHVISLNTLTSGGEAWVSTDKGVGPTKMPGQNRGVTPFLELFDRPTKGYSGILYVGKITAAAPARR